jgi:hypothetical protein
MGQTRPTEGMSETSPPFLIFSPAYQYTAITQKVDFEYRYNDNALTHLFDTDTVERNILDLAARQGLSLYTKENSAGTLNVSSLGMDAEEKTVDSPVKKVQKGDFIFKYVHITLHTPHVLTSI